MASRKSPRPKAPGKNIEDWQRGTERITLRLDPEAMDLLRSYAKSLGVPMSTIVVRALESFKNDPMTRKDMRETHLRSKVDG